MSDEKPKNFFSYLNNINTSNKNIMEDDSDIEAYNSFMINRGLSYFKDTVLFANLMNKNSHLSVKLQYDFYRTAVPKKKRFSKWGKKDSHDDLEVISEYYMCSKNKALEYINILSNAEIEAIKEYMNIGGIQRKK